MQRVDATYTALISQPHTVETKLEVWDKGGVSLVHTFSENEIASLSTRRSLFSQNNPSVGGTVSGEIDCELFVGGDIPTPPPTPPTPTQDITFASSTVTPNSNTSSVSFNVQGNPKVFVCSLTTSASAGTPARVLSVVYDGTSTYGAYFDGSNVNYTTSGYTWSYSGGRLTITSTSQSFGNGLTYKLNYAYGDGTISVVTDTFSPASGITSANFSVSSMPNLFVVQLTSQVSYSQYNRVDHVVYDGTSVNGITFTQNPTYTSNAWNASISNNRLTISPKSTSNAPYFHNPGTYQIKAFIVQESGGGSTYTPTYETPTDGEDVDIPRMAMLRPYVRIKNDSQTSGWIPKGVYWIDTRKKDYTTNKVQIHGYDAMLKGEQLFEQGTTVIDWPRTDIQVLNGCVINDRVYDGVAQKMGVTIQSDSLAMINKEYMVQFPGTAQTSSGEQMSVRGAAMTVREVLGAIGAMYCGNWTIDEDGTMRFVQLGVGR